MDLSGWLRRRALPRPLLVPVPGATPVRWAVERALRERGWTAAVSVAEADLLVVCGEADGALQEAVEQVWNSLPSPRARVDIRVEHELAAALDDGRARLENQRWGHHDAGARGEPLGTAGAVHHGEQLHRWSDAAGDHNGGHVGHEVHATSHGEHATSTDDRHGGKALDHGGHDMSGGDHDMHMMHGGEVAGLAMADRAADRDGLNLDQVHATLGPVLTDWPAGLVARLALQGDVVQSVEVEVQGAARARTDPVATPPVMALDDLAGLLSVCGWEVAARTARRLRDDHRAGTVDAAELRRLGRRVRRSRTLRWATDGLGQLAEADNQGAAPAGDATSRWLRWLDVVDGGVPAGTARRTSSVAAVLPQLLVGREMAAVRVVVASFGADLHELTSTPLPWTTS